MRKSGYRVSNDNGKGDKNVKRSNDLANQGSGGHITSTGPCKTVKVQEEIYRRRIALNHRLQTGHDGVTALCYQQIRIFLDNVQLRCWPLHQGRKKIRIIVRVPLIANVTKCDI